MDEKNIYAIIDKIMESGSGDYDKYDPSLKRLDARSGDTTGQEDREQSYDDWIKSQPKTGRPIGLHKRKKK